MPKAAGVEVAMPLPRSLARGVRVDLNARIRCHEDHGPRATGFPPSTADAGVRLHRGARSGGPSPARVPTYRPLQRTAAYTSPATYNVPKIALFQRASHTGR